MAGSASFTGNLSDIDLRLLRVFSAVVKGEGFSAAEAATGTAKSTISKHLSDLEARLGVKLCLRGRSGFALTPEGELMYEATLQLFADLEAFKTRVNAARSCLDGRLSIGLTDAIVPLGHSPLTTTISTLRKQAPRVHVHLAVDGANEIQRGILDGSFSVGIISSGDRHPALSYEQLHKERSFLYCSDRHPFFSAGAKDAAISPAQPFAMRKNVEAERDYVERGMLTPAATVADINAIAALILSGEYIGFLPEGHALPAQRHGELHQLWPDDFHYSTAIVAAMRRNLPPSPILTRFVSDLAENFRDVTMCGSLTKAAA